MRVHIIQHETYEAPGAYLTWVENHNYEVTFSKIYLNQPLPNSAENIDMLLIMGGPQSPDTTQDECPYYDNKAEKSLILKCINAGKIVVGACLGAQLIGSALGAKHEASTDREIGVFPITLTEAGKNDKNIAHFGEILNIGHWHNDMPGLTPESTILATSPACPRQIIRYGKFVYGLQCHAEFTAEVIKLLIAETPDLQKQSENFPFVQSADEMLKIYFSEMNQKLMVFLDNLVEEYNK